MALTQARATDNPARHRGGLARMIGWTLRSHSKHPGSQPSCILAVVRGLVGHVGGFVAGALLVVPFRDKQVPLFDGDLRR